MVRWSMNIDENFITTKNEKDNQHLLKQYFTNGSYQPKSAEEQKQIEEFSIIAAAMAMMIFVAHADKAISPPERKLILDELIFQLENRKWEFNKLAPKFGEKEKEIVENMFKELSVEFEKGRLHIEETVEVVNLVFMNNPYSKFYLIRMCYACAWSDGCFSEAQKDRIDWLAKEIHIDEENKNRISKEIAEEMSGRKKTC